MDNNISKDCIHCGLCKKNCVFLKKYDIDLSEFEKRNDLAYNCFMCGKCKLVCPKDIDGRLIAKKMRDKEVIENNGKLSEKGYKGLIFEKRNYIFKNYKNVDIKEDGAENLKNGKSVLFTGCNFLSYMPDTANRLMQEMKMRGIDVIFDCCGKPIYELGLNSESEEIIKNLQKRIDKYGITELIMVCPNCYYYLNGKLDVKITDIYTKLRELGIGKNLTGEILVFRPCPDRESETLLNHIKMANKDVRVNCVNEQCCGAGGCASVKEKEISQKMRIDVKEQIGNRKVSTYCSTCFGFFRGENMNVSHILSDILGVEEGGLKNSLLNRMKYKFYKSR